MPLAHTRLRRDATTLIGENDVSIEAAGWKLTFRSKSAETLQQWKSLLAALGVGISDNTQSALASDDATGPFLDSLSRHLMLVRTAVDPHGEQSALAVHSRLTTSILSARSALRQISLIDYLGTDAVPKDVIAGLAIEYYQITARAISSLVPALVHARDPFRSELLRMIVEEYGHDKIMAHGVVPFGVSVGDLPDLIPLPYTHALMRRLSIAARTDARLLSIFLYLFEHDSPSDTLLPSALELSGAPVEFVNAVREHDKLNSQGQHENVSLEMLERFEIITPADETWLSEELWVIANMFARYVNDIIAYYSSSETPHVRNEAAMNSYFLRISNGVVRTAFDSLISVPDTILLSSFRTICSQTPAMLAQLHRRLNNVDSQTSIALSLVELCSHADLCTEPAIESQAEAVLAAFVIRDFLNELADSAEIKDVLWCWFEVLSSVQTVAQKNSALGAFSSQVSWLLNVLQAAMLRHQGETTIRNVTVLGELLECLVDELNAGARIGLNPVPSRRL